MRARGTIRRGAAVAATFLTTGLLLSAGQHPTSASHNTVTSVVGRGFGYWADNITLVGSVQPDTGPTPTASLAADASNSPQTGAAPTGLVEYPPATLFTSDAISVTTGGITGPGGSATTSSSMQNVNKATTQPGTGSEILTADGIASTCTASSDAAPTGSTSITDGTLRTDSGWDANGDGDYVDAGDHAPVVVALPADPAPGTTYTGHIHLGATQQDNFTVVLNEQSTSGGTLTVNAVHEYFGTDPAGSSSSFLKGDLFLGRSVCGVTTVPTPASADLRVGIAESADPIPPAGTVTYTVTVDNHGPDAAGATLSLAVTGASKVTATPSGGSCTIAKGKTKGATCDLGIVAPGGAGTVTVTATAPRKTGTISISASVSSPATDPDTTNDTATESTSVARV